MGRSSWLMVAAVVCFVVPAMGGEKQEIALFNGKDLAGWEYYLVDPNVKMEDVWNVTDGVLVCKGEPMGYLATKEMYQDFQLTIEWRWAGKPGNSGVLMRITGEPDALPRSVEAQLMHGNAGDVWAFKGFQVKGDAARFREIDHEKFGKLVGVSKIEGNEKEPGAWNVYTITAKGDSLKLVVNGKTVNECTGLDVMPGKIGLQSEGGVIEFRRVTLTPIKSEKRE